MGTGGGTGTGGGVGTGGGTGGGTGTGGGVGTGGGAGTGGGSGSGGGAGGAGGGSGIVSFSATVAPILKMKCIQACHGGQYQTTANAYSRLKGTTAAAGTACANMPRIIVNNGAGSLVIQKLKGTQTCGMRMPLVNNNGCTGTDCVAASDITKIETWIDQGAQNN